MDLSLYKPMFILMAGFTFLYLVEWILFRKKSTEFKTQYHPYMTVFHGFGFGILIVILFYSEGPNVWWPIPAVILIAATYTGYFAMKTMKICLNCGHETYTFGNERYKNILTCPKCGVQYTDK